MEERKEDRVRQEGREKEKEIKQEHQERKRESDAGTCQDEK